jgi:hypothetical protein
MRADCSEIQELPVMIRYLLNYHIADFPVDEAALFPSTWSKSVSSKIEYPPA